MRVTAYSPSTEDGDSSPKLRAALASIVFFLLPMALLPYLVDTGRETVEDRLEIANPEIVGPETTIATAVPEPSPPEAAWPDTVTPQPAPIMPEPANPSSETAESVESPALPRILSPSDTELYRQVFALQKRGGLPPGPARALAGGVRRRPLPALPSHRRPPSPPVRPQHARPGGLLGPDPVLLPVQARHRHHPQRLPPQVLTAGFRGRGSGDDGDRVRECAKPAVSWQATPNHWK